MSETAPPAVSDGLEQQIAEMMAGVLRGGPIGHDVSFFEVGGHSLLAMELLVRLEEHLGVEIDVAALYEVATPRAMAAVIRGSEGPERSVAVGEGEPRRFVVPIQPHGSRPPIVAVHVLGSNEEFYRPLAEHLGPDQPLYGLTVPVDHPDPALTSDVDAIVGAYLAELDERFPDEPIGLVGMSLGGPIAFELARRLRAGGREITMVGMLDAGGPDASRYRLGRAERMALQAGRARTEGITGVVSDWAEFQRVRLNRYLERVMLRLVSLTGRAPSVRLAMRRIVENNVKAVRRFTLVPDELAVTVFKGLDDPHSERLVANAMGWGRVARRGVEIVPVPGDHLTMVTEPHVASLAAAVERVVDESVAGSVAGSPAAPVSQDREMLEEALRRSLAEERLVGEVAAMADGSTGGGLDAGARRLLAEVDETLATMAKRMKAESSRVIEHLAGTSIPARPAPIPDRALRATFGLTVARADVDGAIAALEELGYRLQRPLGPAAWTAHRHLDGGVVLIATDDMSTRLHLVWDPHRAAATPGRVGRLVQPSDHDLVAVRLPERLWPLYWLVRPLRLLRDRVVGRRGGGDLGPFLATPQAMLAPLMRVADVGPDDLLVDVGCGDGRVVVEAARRFGCRARGVERDPALVALAREAVTDAGMADRVEIVEGDVDVDSFRDATVVFSFLPPGATAGILELCDEHLRPGARVLTHEQLDTGWPREPDHSELVLGQGVTVARLWRVR